LERTILVFLMPNGLLQDSTHTYIQRDEDCEIFCLFVRSIVLGHVIGTLLQHLGPQRFFLLFSFSFRFAVL